MEKWKAIWKSFIHWPGWTGWLHWKIWGKIARWKGWKTIGSWKGWKTLLFPHPVLVGFLTVAVGFGLGWVFLTGHENSIAAYGLYALSAYALTILIAGIVKIASEVKHGPLGKKLQARQSKGAFGIVIYVDQVINFCYGIFKIVSGVVVGSAWIGADGIYNFTQGLIQLYQILRHKKAVELEQQWKAYRQCGWMMIMLHLTMTGMVFQMIHMGRHQNSSEIMIIATAAFTFYKLINAIVKVAKDRKHKNPVDSAVRFLKFSQALYNLFVLQVGLLWVFGGTEFAYQKLMNSLTGGAVCLLVSGMGVYMLWRAHRDMKKLEENTLG